MLLDPQQQQQKKEFKNLKKHEIFTKMKLIRLVFSMTWRFIKRTDFDKILSDKAFNIPKNPKYDGYQRGFASMVYKFFDKKSSGSGVNMHTNNKTKQNHQLAEELHKPIIKKIKKERFIQDSKTTFVVLI